GRGYGVEVLAGYLGGTTVEAAGRLASTLASALAGQAGRRGLVAGGETTVAVTSSRPGLGGRNLDLAARLALAIRGRRGIAILVGGSDGRDGSSRAAGALVDGGTAARAEAAGLGLEAALEAFDSEPALAAAGDLHVTGPTGTNVGDLVVAVTA
ncbi:MAG: MOFRL family protein, partial [Candidatus Binatia bacterium]